jgi:transposase-like protein
MTTMADSNSGSRVRLVLDEGKSVSAVARELDVVPSALGPRVKQSQAGVLCGKNQKLRFTPKSTFLVPNTVVGCPKNRDVSVPL